MTRRCALGLLLLLLAVATAPVGAAAFDAEQEFAQGTKAIGLSFGGGAQNNVENHGRLSGISFVNFNPRLSYFFFEPFGPSIPNTATNAAARIVISNVTGINDGQLSSGRPPIFSG